MLKCAFQGQAPLLPDPWHTNVSHRLPVLLVLLAARKSEEDTGWGPSEVAQLYFHIWEHPRHERDPMSTKPEKREGWTAQRHTLKNEQINKSKPTNQPTPYTTSIKMIHTFSPSGCYGYKFRLAVSALGSGDSTYPFPCDLSEIKFVFKV